MGFFDELDRQLRGIGNAALARSATGSQLTADAVAAMKGDEATRSYGDRLTIDMARNAGIVLDPTDWPKK